MKRMCLGILISLVSIAGYSAPFCTVFSYGKQCTYYDYNSCLEAAGSEGACVTNGAEMKAPSGSGRFCVVTSFATQCYYYDAETCREAAKASAGVCKVRLSD